MATLKSLAINALKFWQCLTKTRYTRELERTVERLLTENRALLNSLLTIHGHVGIGGEVPVKVPQVNQRKPAHIMAREMEASRERKFKEWQQEVLKERG